MTNIIKNNDIWFISDYHLFHDNILKFNNEKDGKPIRPFSNLKEMHEYIIEKHNSVVKPNDIVYNLGDVFMGNFKKNKESIINILNRLNGKHTLMLGNHDDINNIMDLHFFRKILLWRKFYDENLIASHVPLREDMFNDKYINIHGHTHDSGSPIGRYKSVCVEMVDFTPQNIDQLKEVKNV